MSYNLASFKNSRIYGRKATTSALTTTAVVANSAGPISLVDAANVDRTYLTLENNHATDALRYGYATGGTAPTLAYLLASGMLLVAGAVAADLETPEAIYAVSETLNTIPVTIDKGQG